MLVLAWLACSDGPPESDGEPGELPSDTGEGPTTDTAEPPVPAGSLVVSEPHARGNDREVVLLLARPADAALLCVARDEPDDRFLLESPSAAEHRFRLQALRYGAVYDCTAGPVDPAEPSAIVRTEIRVGPSRDFDPPVRVRTPGGSPIPDGWVLTAVASGGGCFGGTTLAIFDAAGRMRWNFPVPSADIDVEVLHVGDGVLVYGGATNLHGPAALHVWDGEVWAADLPGDNWFHHDAKQLADGRVLTLSEERDHVGNRNWNGFLVRTWDPATGDTRTVYESQRAVDDGLLGPGPRDAPYEEAEDPWHANWVALLDHGAGEKLYVSLCRTWQVLRIDVATGDVDWVFGDDGDLALIDEVGQPLPREQFTQCQHGLEVSDDGTRLLAYDNGIGRAASRAVEYAIDAESRVAQRLWQWDGEGWFEGSLGDVDRLPNGDVLLTRAHPECWSYGSPSAILMFDPVSGDEHWRMSFLDPEDAIYRSEWLDGCALFSNVGQCAALEPRWAELAAVLPVP